MATGYWILDTEWMLVAKQKQKEQRRERSNSSKHLTQRQIHPYIPSNTSNADQYVTFSSLYIGERERERDLCYEEKE